MGLDKRQIGIAANVKQTVVRRNGLCEGCSVLSECLHRPLGAWALYVHSKKYWLYLNTYIHTYTICIHICMHTYLYTYIHTYIHIIYIYIYISTRVGTLVVATIYLQLIQNRYMFRSFTVLQCSHQHCVQPVASDVEVVRYL